MKTMLGKGERAHETRCPVVQITHCDMRREKKQRWLVVCMQSIGTEGNEKQTKESEILNSLTVGSVHFFKKMYVFTGNY